MTNPQQEDLRETFSGDLLKILHASRPHHETRAEADYIVDVLDLKPGMRVLDVPCGPGRISLELASRGYKLVGIDIAEPEIELSRQKATELGLAQQIDFRVGDMRDLPWEKEFDAAYCFWESFGYFDDEGNQAFLNSAAKVLKPGGKLLIDTHIAESLFHHTPSKHWNWLDESIWMEEWYYDLEESRFHRHWIFVKIDRIEQRELSIRIYTYRQLKAMLEQAGFVAFEPYNLLTRRRFSLGKVRLNLVAVKGS